MEELMQFTGIVMIVFGILQIILFFKVWGMTNNLAKIKNGLLKDNALIIEAQIASLKGENDRAYELYKECFYLGVIDLYKKTKYRTCDDQITSYWESEYKLLVKDYNGRINKLGSYALETSKYNTYEKVSELIGK